MADRAAPEEEPWRWPQAEWERRVNRVRAGRSLCPASWPGGARCAVALSFDSDHDTNELRDGGRSIGRMSWGQYGNRVGVPRILELLRRTQVPATFFVPAVSALLYPDEQRRVVAEGQEVGLHGWIHELNSILPAKDEREMGLLYDSSLMADDDPYEIDQDGVPTGIVEPPVEWIRDDAVSFNMNRSMALRPYTAPSVVLDIFRREFDQAVQEGGLFLLTMHPHVIGYRSRMFILDELVRHMQAQTGVWFATHRDVARHVKAVL